MQIEIKQELKLSGRASPCFYRDHIPQTLLSDVHNVLEVICLSFKFPDGSSAFLACSVLCFFLRRKMAFLYLSQLQLWFSYSVLRFDLLPSMGHTSQDKNCRVFLVCVTSCPKFVFFSLPSKSVECEVYCSPCSLGYSGMKSDIYGSVKAY